MWQVIVRAPRDPEPDIKGYRFYLDNVFVDEVPQPVGGDAQYTYTIATDGSYALQVTAVDKSGNENPQKSEALVTLLDHVNPAVMEPLLLVSATWVP